MLLKGKSEEWTIDPVQRGAMDIIIETIPSTGNEDYVSQTLIGGAELGSKRKKGVISVGSRSRLRPPWSPTSSSIKNIRSTHPTFADFAADDTSIGPMIHRH